MSEFATSVAGGVKTTAAAGDKAKESPLLLPEIKPVTSK